MGPGQDAINLRKHRLPLSIAEVALADPLALSRHDPHPDGDRWDTLCQADGVLLFIVHTWPDAVTDWSGAERGALYRPVKRLTSLRLDADLLEWFKRGGEGYQTRINAALRKYVERHQR
jgi:hypothetical protein